MLRIEWELTHISPSAPMQDRPKTPEFLDQNEGSYSRNAVKSLEHVEVKHHSMLSVGRGGTCEQGQIC